MSNRAEYNLEYLLRILFVVYVLFYSNELRYG
jgi:hypothetical protein